MTPRPLRAAVVGTGGIARGIHLPALAALSDEVEIVGVVDIDGERARETAAEFDTEAFTDLDTLLATAKPDLVVVATPPGAHKAAAIAALDAGASVWCEKPPALSLADYDEIASHEGADGPYATYVFQHRFGSAATRLRRHIDEGTLGAPRVAQCHTLWYRDDAYFEVPWRAKWATEGGGPTMGHGIHQMDLALSLLGEWTEVTALMGTLARNTETEDVSAAVVRFASGALCTVTNSLLSPRESSLLRFDFDDATVEVEHLYGYDNSHWRWTGAAHIDDQTVASWHPADDLASSHAAQLRVLVDAIRRGERPPASGADGRRSLELVAGM
ncbi:Gfo/Idh/MocA family protein [Microbacterium sp. C7(2022)]|uniref:Gfo/Idh/MocA family protein n=1 Tax=Microbacterium sp. C7(2022) TaxID=2992759 RepID=UPI00237BB4D6|nr:Gfo/Idh/MocA family oxidoreductase [Microbacterium sp. C7(2022)]MDE0546655.1 Gfo/Idh/MocA family oxidoreductase [Microbacterium sp. C7(2022)]